MYADDTNVTFSAPSIPDLELQINTELKHIDLWLKANNLSLNVAKTESMIISSGQKLQSLNDYTIKICNDGVQINETTHSKFIGLTDDNLSWKAHQHDISKKPPQTLVRLKGLCQMESMRSEVIQITFNCQNSIVFNA